MSDARYLHADFFWTALNKLIFTINLDTENKCSDNPNFSFVNLGIFLRRVFLNIESLNKSYKKLLKMNQISSAIFKSLSFIFRLYLLFSENLNVSMGFLMDSMFDHVLLFYAVKTQNCRLSIRVSIRIPGYSLRTEMIRNFFPFSLFSGTIFFISRKFPERCSGITERSVIPEFWFTQKISGSFHFQSGNFFSEKWKPYSQS